MAWIGNNIRIEIAMQLLLTRIIAWTNPPSKPGRCFTTLGELFKWVFVQTYFRGSNWHPDFMAHFVLEIRWRLRIDDAKPSSNFEHKSGCRSDSNDTPSKNLQHQENSLIIY